MAQIGALAYLRGMDQNARNALTIALAALFALGAIEKALEHNWWLAGLSAAVVPLALFVVYRRRKAANAKGS
jgi:hypothetical protein